MIVTLNILRSNTPVCTVQLAHVPLHNTIKSSIASQLLQGVPATEILDKIRNSVDSTFGRVHLTTRKDIQNISQMYSLYDKAIKHQNDSISVSMWIKENSQGADSICILHKMQGVPLAMEAIKDEDFLLGIMTKSQCEMLKKFGNNGIVCMDATHGTNPYDFYLISLLVVDDFGEGFPVAFLLSNREDYVSLKYFINAVKERCGSINAKTFMTDDAEQYYSAWSSLMDVSQTRRLLCTWHIDRAWRNKITLIKNKARQEQVYKTLCVLRQETDVNTFTVYLDSFLTWLQSNEYLMEFATYFKTYYISRCNLWAACYRIDCSINTNMYLESMHKILKYIYLNGKVCKRLDKTIYVLLKYVRDKQFGRVTKLEKGKLSYKQQKINKSHLNAVSSDMTITFKGNSWTVHSETNIYEIFKNTLNDNHSCHLKCANCMICVHAYSCNCMDYAVHSNMCKHIHKLCINEKYVSEISESIIHNEDKETEINMHLETINKSNKTTNTLLQDISKNLATLSNFNWTCLDATAEANVLQRVNDHLRSAVNLISLPSKGSTFNTSMQQTPANKKIDTQLRFHSTKKKRKTVNRLRKPTSSELQSIRDALGTQEEV